MLGVSCAVDIFKLTASSHSIYSEVYVWMYSLIVLFCIFKYKTVFCTLLSCNVVRVLSNLCKITLEFPFQKNYVFILYFCILSLYKTTRINNQIHPICNTVYTMALSVQSETKSIENQEIPSIGFNITIYYISFHAFFLNLCSCNNSKYHMCFTAERVHGNN